MPQSKKKKRNPNKKEDKTNKNMSVQNPAILSCNFVGATKNKAPETVVHTFPTIWSCWERPNLNYIHSESKEWADVTMKQTGDAGNLQ